MDTGTKPIARSSTRPLASYAERLVQKMTAEEALKGAHRMLSAYPEPTKDLSLDYLMTLAETLVQFPLEVATKACSPVHGVPKELKSFRPTAGQVYEWCDREAQWLHRMASRSPEKAVGAFLSPPPTPTTSEAERCAHVARVLGRKLSASDTGDRKQPGWMTEQDARDTLQRYEREARQNQIIDEELL